MIRSQAKAPSSGKIISINLSFDRCLIYDFVTKREISEIIEKYNTERFRKFWEEELTKVIHDNGAIYLEGFKSRKGKSNRLSLNYLKHAPLQKLLNTGESGTSLVGKIQGLPIEEQRKLLSKSAPKNHQGLHKVSRLAVPLFGMNMLDELSEHSTVESFIDKITIQASEGNHKQNTIQSCDLLILFRNNGLLLLPLNFRSWKCGSKWAKLVEYNPEINELAKQVYTSSITKLDGVLALILSYFAVTSTANRADLSAELIYAYSENTKKIWQKDKNLSETTNKNLFYRLDRAVKILLASYNTENPDVAVTITNRRAQTSKKAPRDLNFGWIATKHPPLSSWSKYLHLYMSGLKSARLGHKLTSINILVDFFGTLENPPKEPWLVLRHLHICDPTLINDNTFYEYLLSQGSTNGKRFKSILTNARQFFNWLRDYLIANGQLEESKFLDPVLETDKLGKHVISHRTTRDSLPPFLITEMKSALIENDFEIPRSFGRSAVQTTDQTTGYSVRVFYPGIAICMYTLLDTPLRSHQARWLDSGLLDEKIYNHTTHRTEYNPSPYAIKGRHEGVLQLRSDTLRAESWLSMWVNTNKTAESLSEVGYHIPYVSPDLENLIKTQVDWSARYLPEPKAPLKYRDYMQEARGFRPNVVKGPEVSPLFRDPTTIDQKLPVSYERLVRFYTLLLEVVEKRIYEKHGHKLRLITVDEKGKRSWAVDLHSLRVSGITNLIEAGVPIEVVQQYVVGHKVLIMTLHYLKYSPGKLRKFIEDAHERMQNDQDFVGSQSFISAINEFAPFLLSQIGAGTGAGFDALNIGDGILIVNSDGICPGTSCNVGMVIKEGANPVYGPVPGRRCGLCRFWLTGPAHLLGQITAVNNLAYVIRKKGQELVQLNEKKFNAEDAGNRRLARELRDRIDLLNREIELDVAEWASRYRYAEQSIILLNDYLQAKEKIIATDATPRVPMITASTPFDLKITLEHAHEFALLDQITQLTDFNPGFTNLQAELEKHEVLSKMMVANGMKPFLLFLSKEQAREAGNLLSALVLQQVNAQDLDEVLTGKMTLENYPFLSLAISKLEKASANNHSFLPNALSALTQLLDPADPVARPQTNQDDEDFFG